MFWYVFNFWIARMRSAYKKKAWSEESKKMWEGFTSMVGWLDGTKRKSGDEDSKVEISWIVGIWESSWMVWMVYVDTWNMKMKSCGFVFTLDSAIFWNFRNTFSVLIYKLKNKAWLWKCFFIYFYEITFFCHHRISSLNKLRCIQAII